MGGGRDTRVFVDPFLPIDLGVRAPEFVGEPGDAHRLLDRGEDLLAEVAFEQREVLLGEVDVEDPVDLLVPQLFVVFSEACVAVISSVFTRAFGRA